MAKKTEAEIDAEVAAELAAEQAAMAQPSEPVKRILEVDLEKKIITVGSRTVTKLGLGTAFQLYAGAYTSVDAARDRAVMTEETYGVRCEVTSKINQPGGVKSKVTSFLVPWSNITYVLYGV